MSRTIRTFEATITNQQQVRDDLDQLGWAASKLWNVGRYYAQEQWDETGEIPDDGELKAELKGHDRYTDLHSQSSQRVLEELAEAFNGWLAQPAVHLFDRSEGCFAPREQVVNRES